MEIIQTLTQKPMAALSQSEEFVSFLQSSILPNVIENTTSNFPKIQQPSLNILQNLIRNFRRHFRDEIPLVIEEVVLKLLNSVNNKSDTKMYLIRFLAGVIGDTRVLLEFFLNFDCNFSYNSVVEKIISTLCSLSITKLVLPKASSATKSTLSPSPRSRTRSCGEQQSTP